MIDPANPSPLTVAELQLALNTEQQARQEAVNHYESLFRRIPAIAHSLNATGKIIAVSDHWLTTLGYSRDEVIGRPSLDFLTPACREDVIQRSLPAFMASGHASNEPYQMVRRNGEIIEGLLSATAEYDAGGAIVRTLALVADITQLRRQETALRESEQQRLALQNEVIKVQEQAIRDLSTPLLAIAPGLLVMPLIGSIDERRAEHLFGSLLAGVQTYRARSVILDITGVPVVDAKIAHLLLRGMQAVGLLGARMLLTGINPEVAATIVGLGLSFGEIPTFSSLQAGIAAAGSL
jgi:rsbT co-antagonist protein RsbR